MSGGQPVKGAGCTRSYALAPSARIATGDNCTSRPSASASATNSSRASARPTLCSAACSTHAVPPLRQSWLDRALAMAERALHASAGWWRPVQAAPADLDLDSLAYLNDAPDTLRAYAAQRREQAKLLRQIDAHHGAVQGARW